MTTWCAPTGKRRLPYPCPSDDGWGTSAPWASCPPGPSSAFSSEVPLGALPLVPLRRMPWDSSFFLRLFLPGHRCHRRLLVRRLTGGLLPSVVWGTAPGAQFRTWRCALPGGRGPRSPTSTAGFLSSR
ncbi:hypothetical protein GWK47_021381 [Chionoecetes opilio]|uniref:Uncharacterized protein n=1 Tax=Chionoecetes opilio TaxID=41210 RepID=A0A8J4XPK0_CHIOP|nr:hypothetical protein GWK47_021381 [Chionoecetes opilio]